ncbi:hypothetical protein B0H19DRAFT_949973, partial [Mycena capillaripes]
IWNILLTEKIHLKDLTTDSVTNEFIEYVSSYSGLERLSLLHSGGNVGFAEADTLADLFFEKALPCHADTLVAFGFSAAYEGRWSFGSHNVEIISRLVCLASLETSVNLEDIAEDTEPVTKNAVVSTAFGLSARN